MALTRLTCPACARMLEIDDESLGQEIECGACSQVFVAGSPLKRASDSFRGTDRSGPVTVDQPKKKGRKRRRDRDDDDDLEYDYDDYDPRPHRRGRRYREDQKSRVAYIILAVFLGNLGIHNFYAGRTSSGIAQLLITVISIPLMFACIGFVTFWIPYVWSLIEIIVVEEDGNRVPMAS